VLEKSTQKRDPKPGGGALFAQKKKPTERKKKREKPKTAFADSTKSLVSSPKDEKRLGARSLPSRTSCSHDGTQNEGGKEGKGKAGLSN